MYLSGPQPRPEVRESQLVTSVLLERCGDSAVRHNNRVIPVIQEEAARTPTPSLPSSTSAQHLPSPALISVTPATPRVSPSPGPQLVTITISESPPCPGSLVSPDQLSCHSAHSTPVNRWLDRRYI